MAENLPPDTDIILYQTEGGDTRIETRLHGETVWLNQKSMAELFQKDVRTINEHVRNILEERELTRDRTIRKFRIVQNEGPRRVARDVEHYNLEMIISVGYRVRSHRGTQFRIWATSQLREYLVKGFTLDDQRLKNAGDPSYFNELLARIRDIRSSERVFWKKVLEIYATSLDYDPHTECSRTLFSTIQNKMHWAAHGHTAAEIIHNRADASKPAMGLTNWKGKEVRKADINVAKNYLNAGELDALNRIVSMYLDFAEFQAMNHKPMYMRDWVVKLDDFLRMNERDVLSHVGKISHKHAVNKAVTEYEKFRSDRELDPTRAELHLEEILAETKQIDILQRSKERSR